MRKEAMFEVLGDLDESYIKDAHNTAPVKVKKPVWVKWGSMAACLCLVMVCAVTLFPSKQYDTMTGDPVQSVITGDPIKPGETASDVNNTLPGVAHTENAITNNKIIINTINGISTDRMNVNLMMDDFIEMSPEEMREYYGIDYIPDVPVDIKPWREQRSGIYKRNGGTGEVYWDANILNYSNEDFTRNVHIEVDKGSYVLQDYLYFKGTEEKSVINNVDVLIGLTENGYYYSEFMYKGVGFLINADGVTEEEFVAIISSIIK